MWDGCMWEMGDGTVVGSWSQEGDTHSQLLLLLLVLLAGRRRGMHTQSSVALAS